MARTMVRYRFSTRDRRRKCSSESGASRLFARSFEGDGLEGLGGCVEDVDGFVLRAMLAAGVETGVAKRRTSVERIRCYCSKH